jgi:predicted  nucleic acid-binding Zn-ribbon protein
MMVPKTVLAVALLLAAAAAAQWTSLESTGPYDYKPWSTRHVYLLWFPPHAVPMNLTLLNVTWGKPEAIWFVGKYPVHICRPDWCGYVPATIYVVQDGVYVRKDVRTASYHIVTGFVEWHIKNRFCAQGTAMVAPNKIIVLNYTTQIWISDVYCLHGNNWFWLRLLPYILRDELTVEGVEAVEFRDTRVFVSVPAAPPGDYVIPGGWYLDPATKRVFRIPNDTAVMAELQRLRMRVSELEAELANKTAQLARLNATLIQLDVLNSTIAQLNSTIAQLNAALAEARGEAARLAAENQRLRAQLEALNYTCAQLEEELSLCQSRLETLQAANATLTAQLTQLKAENSQLKAKAAELNESLAKLKDAYTTQVAQLQSQLETWTRAAWIGAALGAAAGAAVASLALRRRK